MNLYQFVFLRLSKLLHPQSDLEVVYTLLDPLSSIYWLQPYVLLSNFEILITMKILSSYARNYLLYNSKSYDLTFLMKNYVPYSHYGLQHVFRNTFHNLSIHISGKSIDFDDSRIPSILVLTFCYLILRGSTPGNLQARLPKSMNYELLTRLY